MEKSKETTKTEEVELAWKTMKMEDMMAYIEKYHKEDKEWFKGVALKSAIVQKRDEKGRPVKDSNGNIIMISHMQYDHFKAREAFCDKYMPELKPKRKEQEPTKANMLLNW